MPRAKNWPKDGAPAALLYILFEDGIFSYDEYSPSQIYNHENKTLRDIWAPYSAKGFTTYCQSQANAAKAYRKFGTMREPNFLKTIAATRKQYVQLLRQLCEENQYDDEGRRTAPFDDDEAAKFTPDPADPDRPLDDSFLRNDEDKKRKEKKKEEKKKERPATMQPTTSAHKNTVLGKRLMDSSYPDYRAICWLGYSKGNDSDSSRIQIGKATKTKVFALTKLSEETTKVDVMLKKHEFSRNNVHRLSIGRKLKEKLEKHRQAMRQFASEVDLEEGWTCQLAFVLPYEVDDQLYDANGAIIEDPIDVKTGQLFWLKKRGMPDNDESDIEIEMD